MCFNHRFIVYLIHKVKYKSMVLILILIYNNIYLDDDLNICSDYDNNTVLYTEDNAILIYLIIHY